MNGCQPSQVAAMRRAVFDTIPVKDIEVIGFDGQTLCTQLGMPLGQRSLSASERLAGADGYSIDILRLADGGQMVRLRRKVGPTSIAALMPNALFLPQVSTRDFDFLLALPIDHLAEPNVEGDKRHAGEQHARGDRDNIAARECAQKPIHPSAEPALPGVLVVSHATVKARLNLRRDKPDRPCARGYD